MAIVPTLRLRTGYSFRSAVGDVGEIAAMTEGDGVAPITDRSSAYGWTRWAKAVRDAGGFPALGIELAVTPDIHAKPRPIVDWWTFLPADGGIAPLSALVALATSQFRYMPLLEYGQAMGAEGVFAIAGPRAIAEEVAKHPVRDTHYYGLGPSSTRGHVRRMEAAGLPFASCMDNAYPKPDDRAWYETACGRGAETRTWPQHVLDTSEWHDAVKRNGVPHAEAVRAVERSAEVLAVAADAEIGAAGIPPKRGRDSLAVRCESGLAKLGIPADDSNPAYRDRLAKELRLIDDKGFAPYFHLVADLCGWARERMLVGPARGSSCGSLVCYALGITRIDPIPHGLIFERFVDTTRHDLPDIDVDFPDTRRDEVIAWLKDRHGEENVAKIGSVSMYKPRSALKEAGASLGIPPHEIETVLRSVMDTSSGDSRANDSIEDAVASMPEGRGIEERHPGIGIAYRMEGQPRHAGQHASGVIVNSAPVAAIAPVDGRTGAMMLDKKDAEAVGLLKVDVLGLTQLSIIDETLDAAGRTREWLEAVPPDDEAALAALNGGRLAGVFQFEGKAVANLARNTVFRSLDDIATVTALARPGPLISGNADRWLQRRAGKLPVEYGHDLFRPHTEDTLGIVVYQEQVMTIGRDVGDLGWEEVTALRKAMSRSLGREYFDRFGDPWKRAAVAKGVPEEVAAEQWDNLCDYGAWAFNKSHSVAYATVSWWCLVLKSRWPFEFAAATLNHESDPKRARSVLRELAEEGISHVPVDADLSTDRWTAGERDGKRVLVGPLHLAKGIGPKTERAVLGARARGEPIPEGARKRLADAVTPLDSLWPIHDARLRIVPDLRKRGIVTEPTEIDSIHDDHREGRDVVVIGVAERVSVADENAPHLVARRGHAHPKGEPTASLRVHIEDDTGILYGKVGRWHYKRVAPEIIRRGRIGKALWAFKGKVTDAGGTLLVMMIAQARYLGDIEHD